MNKSTSAGVVAAIGIVMAIGIAAYVFLGKKAEVGERLSAAATPRLGALTQTVGRAVDPRPTVATKPGTLQGDVQEGVRVFRGIPFAAPPLGALRWAPPQAPAAWQGVRDATKFGPDCPIPAGFMRGFQGDAGSVHGAGYDVWIAKMEAGGAEDCLTLNVWTPDPAPSNAAVMVFFSPTASGSLPFFDGGSFARDGVVFVSPNSRMFTQGIFAHPALTREALPGKPYTRFIEADRIAALEWVRDNIAAFGGDPGNVTIFGESNSGASVLALMATPKAAGLFHRAIVQSGSSRGGALLSHEGMESIGVELASMAALDGANATVEQLRALSIDALPFFAASTTNDALMQRSTADSFELGETLDVALMIGGNTWDGSSLRYPPSTIVARTPADVLEAYEHESLSGDALGAAIYTDEHVNAPARWFAGAQARRGAPVYLYIYSYVSSFRPNQPGAAHGEELPYVFDSWDKVPELARVVNDRDRGMTKVMHDCWVAFARTGHPRCAGVPEWPAYEDTTDWTMELAAAPQLHKHYRQMQYAAQDRYKDRDVQSISDGREVIDALHAAK
jgi:para-nitrobenzyl esterase